MSIKVMTLVWSYAPPEVTQGKLLVLLAMADYCDDDGHNIFPLMRTLGEKARLTESQARRVVAELIDLGLVERVDKGGWDKERQRNRPSEYRIVVETLYERSPKEGDGGGRKMRVPAPARPPRAQKRVEGGRTDASTVGASQPQSSPVNSANPSSEPSSDPSVDQNDADDALRAKLREIDAPVNRAALRYYGERVKTHGLAAVLEGLDRAAAHGKQAVRSYVDKCIASAATGAAAPDPDAARRRAYLPAEYRDIIRG